MTKGKRMRYERSIAIARRHDTLVKLIHSGKFSSRDLAAKLKVSEQTIYRDIDFLKQRGYLIRSERHAEGWAYCLIAEPGTGSGVVA